MSTTIDKDRLVPPPLNDSETEMVKTAERMIMACLDHSRSATITIESDDGSSPSVQVPPQILRVLGQTLGLMARHQPIMLVPEKQELSTVEAGRLIHRMVGAHRRIRFADLMDYAKAMRAKQQEALDKKADNARELGLEY